MIEIQDTSKISKSINSDVLKDVINHILTDQKKTNCDLTLRITDDNEIQNLNKTYRGMDQPTDVLSFEQNFIDPATDRRYLGDIVISAESAKRQADDQHHPLEEEIILLCIHGTLHLLGFDHQTEPEKTEMWAQQEAYLSQWLHRTEDSQ